MQYTIPDVHPTAVISAFHQNVRNRKMREALAMNKVKDVAELYVLADRCARAEEWRKYPGEDAGTKTDSTDEDTAAPTKKGRRRNRKRKGKTVLAIEGSGDPGAAKKAKADDPARKLPGVPLAGPWRLPTSQEPPTSSTARSITPRAMTSRTADRLSCLLKSRKLNMKGGTRRRVRMVLRGPTRSVVAKEVAAAKIINKRGPLRATTRRKKMMIMTRTTSSASTNSRKLQRPCALKVAPHCTPLTAN